MSGDPPVLTFEDPNGAIIRITMMAIADLRSAFDPDNPNEVEDAAAARLTGSMLDYGTLEHPVLNTRTQKLIAGHHRIEAAEKTGHTHVPVTLVDLPEEQAEAAALALNAEYGTFNQVKLKKKLDELLSKNYDLEMTYLPTYQIEDLYAAAPVWNASDEDLDTFLDRTQTHTCPRCGYEFREGQA